MRWMPCLLVLSCQVSLAAPPALHPEPLHRGEVVLSPCEVGNPGTAMGTLPAFCADILMPERRAGGASRRRIPIHVAVLPATATPVSPDPIVFLAGGPGQAATEAYPAIAPAFAAWRRHRDVVLVDQRGTGASHPLACAPATGDVPGGGEADSPARARTRARECLEVLSATADVAAYTTTETVADLAAVQQALGVREWNIVAVSYGTRVAQRFALAHPGRTRSLVLDSAVPADANLAADTGPSLDHALKARFAACVATPRCAGAFGDPWEALVALRSSLSSRPMDVSYRDPATGDLVHGTLTASRLEATVRLAAYAPETAALLALFLDRASSGDAAALMALGDMAEGELASLEGNVLQLSVLCTEDPPLGPATPQERASFLGTRTRDVLAAQCSAWPPGLVPPGFHDVRRIGAPALVLQGGWDPATPPWYGRRVAAALPRGVFLLARGQGHNVLLRGCLPKVVEDFLDDPSRPVSASCVERMAPLPDVIDGNGAGP